MFKLAFPIVAAFAIGPVGFGYQSAAATSVSSASPVVASASRIALDDPTIVAIFDEANTADVETGKLAEKMGSTKEIRDFGAMLARDHANVRQQGRDLANKLSNPVASLISVPFQENLDFNGGPDGDGVKSTLNFQPVVPISLGDKWNLILRTIVPIVSQQEVTGRFEGQFGLSDFVQRTNYLRFHMARLRRKLEDNPARPRHLLTEPGMGYRYQP